MLSVISYPVFALSVVVALVLSISLFPVGWFEFRPEWLGLVVFYWPGAWGCCWMCWRPRRLGSTPWPWV